MVEILKLMLNRDFEIGFDRDFCKNCDMNSTLRSVVPLAMFLLDGVMRMGLVPEFCYVLSILDTSVSVAAAIAAVCSDTGCHNLIENVRCGCGCGSSYQNFV